MKYKLNIKKSLNLSIADLLNQSVTIGKLEFPSVPCYVSISPDYLVLYKDLREYKLTDKTCLCFYQNDCDFDGINGLFNSIYYGDKKLQKKYKERFKDIKYAIAPDYSELGDLPYIENAYRIFKARIVSLWLLLECNIQVISNITYANEEYFDIMLDGIEDSTIVAFSTKGVLKNKLDKKLLTKAVKYVVDHMKNLKIIIVYSVAIHDEEVLKLFSYAILKGIDVVIPNNLLKRRNKEMRYGKK